MQGNSVEVMCCQFSVSCRFGAVNDDTCILPFTSRNPIQQPYKLFTFVITMYKLVTCLILLFAVKLPAQICTLPGQTPASAFPICSNGIYNQPYLTACRNNSVYVPGCTDARTNYGDNNPFYYKFSCFAAGSFAFTITPVIATDDYDWQLFDITAHNPNDIFTDKTLTVTGNWSGSLGSTGASAAGVNFIQCRSNPFFEQKPTFSSMPQLQAGHDYVLLIGHADDVQNGFSLSVAGGTADITSKAPQQIKANAASCDNKQVLVVFSQKIRCSSIAADGSDFSLPAAGIVSAAGINCSNSFDTDSILVTFSTQLSSGTYTLFIKNGSDGNTLLDNCNSTVSNNTPLAFGVFSFAALDSALPAGCQPDKIILQLKKNIQCSSVAADGSDFIITGTSPLAITGANTVCTNTAFTNRVEILLQQPVVTAGNYIVTLKTGTDGNTIVDACNNATPAGEAVSFIIKDTVNAIKEGCIADTVDFYNAGKNGVNSWYWIIDNKISTQQHPFVTFLSGGFKQAELIVNNGLCTAAVQQVFVLKQKLSAGFTAPLSTCPSEMVVFKNNSSNALSWFWDFSNGNTSNLQNPPPQQYPFAVTAKNYTVLLTVQNGNCALTDTKDIIVEASCTVGLPAAFTPNGDGTNDFFGPLNSSTASNMQFIIYNRYGQIVFNGNTTNTKWNGTLNNKLQPTGVYTWFLKYTDRIAAKNILQKGTVVLIR
jgi:gliding motility-associated-like protein